MMNKNYPKNLVLTHSDFDAREFHEVISRAKRHQYVCIISELASVGNDYMNKGDVRKGKMYRIFYDACSMALKPENPSNPFIPFMDFGDVRSAAPGDFTEKDILFFESIVPFVDDVLVKARLADLVWVRNTNVTCALEAIASYIKNPIVDEKWFEDGGDCWHRAVSLAKKLGNNQSAKDMLREMEALLVESVVNFNDACKIAPIQIARIMLNNRMGKAQADKIACALEEIERQGVKSFPNQLALCDLSSEWYKESGNREKSIGMLWHKAEMLIERVRDSVKNGERGFKVMLQCEEAARALNEIPNSHKDAYEVDIHLKEMYRLKENGAKLAREQAAYFESKPIDISAQVNCAKTFVSGKDTIEKALVALACIWQFVSVDDFERKGIKQLKKGHVHSYFPSCIIEDGRVVSHTPGIDGKQDLDGQTPKVQENMMMQYDFHCQYIVKAYIMPALDAIKKEHHIEKSSFLAIAEKCSVIPEDRKDIFADGMYAGYNYDFLGALNTLIPQFENMIRHILKENGARTVDVKNNGIEREKGLGGLLRLAEMQETFSENFIFEIDALFHNERGPNLRNTLAHGLSGKNASNSYFGIYAWWFIFRMVQFWRDDTPPELSEWLTPPDNSSSD